MCCFLECRELEAAAALVDPERKDSLLLSLNKKVELLDCKLKEVETEHAQKLMLGLCSVLDSPFLVKRVFLSLASLGSSEEKLGGSVREQA